MFVLLQMMEQCLCAIWNFSIDEHWRYKILRSDALTNIVSYLDEEDIKVKEAAGGIISNLALSPCNHGALVEASVIPKLVSCIVFHLNKHPVQIAAIYMFCFNVEIEY